MYSFLLLVIFVIISVECTEAQNTNEKSKSIFSIHPAEKWQDALISGNGVQGILVFGDPAKEKVIFNHEYLYEPLGSTDVEPPEIGKYLEETRKLLQEGKYEEAINFSYNSAVKEGYAGLQWTDPYHPAFVMKLQQEGIENYSDYRRSVNFDTGEIEVCWVSDGIKHSRKSFVSRPDNIIVQIINNSKNSVDCSISLDMQGASPRLWADRSEFPPEHEKPILETNENWLSFRLKYKLNNKGYEALTKIIAPAANTKIINNTLHISGAESVLMISRIVTVEDFNKSQINKEKASLETIPANYDALLEKHSKIHGNIFNRLDLDIYPDNLPQHANEELIANQLELKDSINPELLEKLFYMGRYALLSSSGNNPPNLMGLWNGQWRPAWSGDFTTDANINLQIAGANIGNMSEAIDSYMKMLERIAPDWEINAENIYGCRGYLAGTRTSGQRGLHTHFDVQFPGHFWLAGAQWLILPCYEYYQVSGDREFLKDRLVPMMEKTALFFEDFLTEYDENGNLFFAPSYSPENRPTNQKTQSSVNATMDIAAAKESIVNLVAVYKELEIKPEKRKQLEDLLDKFPPYLINEHGALKEWAVDDLEDNNKHRHASHLYPIWPGHEINPEETPLLFKNAVKAAEMRERGNDSAHGLMHMALIGTRLKNPEIVHDNLYFLLKNNFLYNSLFTSHNPNLQIYNSDALCSMPAVVLESLVYSRPGFIEFFPAMDIKFPKGKASNINCRTKALVKELQWNNKTGEYKISIESQVEQELTIMFRHYNTSISINGEESGEVTKGEQFKLGFRAGEIKTLKVKEI